MKVMIKQITLWVCVIVTVAVAAEYHIRTTNHVYQAAYAESTQCFRQWLIDVDFAEYDRKTGDWKLSDADTIQGSLIKPWERKLYANIEDHIDTLEHELMVLRKQQETLNKRKPTASNSKPDLTKSPL